MCIVPHIRLNGMIPMRQHGSCIDHVIFKPTTCVVGPCTRKATLSNSLIPYFRVYSAAGNPSTALPLSTKRRNGRDSRYNGLWRLRVVFLCKALM